MKAQWTRNIHIQALAHAKVIHLRKIKWWWLLMALYEVIIHINAWNVLFLSSFISYLSLVPCNINSWYGTVYIFGWYVSGVYNILFFLCYYAAKHILEKCFHFIILNISLYYIIHFKCFVFFSLLSIPRFNDLFQMFSSMALAIVE